MTRLLAAVALSAVCYAQQGMIVRSKLSSIQPVGRLSAKASAIVVASFRDAVQSGPLVSGRLRVERTLKGPILANEEVYVQANVPGIGVPNSVQVSGLWFLSGEPGSWSLMPVNSTSQDDFADMYLRVPIASLQNVPGSASVNEKVAGELASALLTPSADSSIAMQMAFLAGEMPPTLVMQGIYDTLADASDLHLQAIGLSGFIESGDAALNREAIARLATNAELRNLPAFFPGSSLCNSRPSDPESIRLLATIVIPASNLSIARCAAYALRAVHAPAALPYLAALLDHSDRELRYEGVMGLASFANNLSIHDPKASTTVMDWLVPLPGTPRFATSETRAHFPSFATFGQDEARYVNFWKRWWRDHRSELTGQ